MSQSRIMLSVGPGIGRKIMFTVVFGGVSLIILVSAVQKIAQLASRDPTGGPAEPGKLSSASAFLIMLDRGMAEDQAKVMAALIGCPELSMPLRVEKVTSIP